MCPAPPDLVKQLDEQFAAELAIVDDEVRENKLPKLQLCAIFFWIRLLLTQCFPRDFYNRLYFKMLQKKPTGT